MFFTLSSVDDHIASTDIARWDSIKRFAKTVLLSVIYRGKNIIKSLLVVSICFRFPVGIFYRWCFILYRVAKSCMNNLSALFINSGRKSFHWFPTYSFVRYSTYFFLLGLCFFFFDRALVSFFLVWISRAFVSFALFYSFFLICAISFVDFPFCFLFVH